MAMKVECKYCGAENTKDELQHVVICPKCGKKTSYFVFSPIIKPKVKE